MKIGKFCLFFLPTDVQKCWWAYNVFMHLLLRKSQTLIVLSSLAEIIYLPPGWKTIPLTQLSWPDNVKRHCPEPTSQIYKKKKSFFYFLSFFKIDRDWDISWVLLTLSENCWVLVSPSEPFCVLGSTGVFSWVLMSPFKFKWVLVRPAGVSWSVLMIPG